jgi:hypothetical protein
MVKTKRFVLFLFIFLHCGPVGSKAAKVLLIRHGEKNAKSKYGDVHLNYVGKVRSEALANLFFPSSDAFTSSEFDLKLPPVSLVIAQNASDMFPSKRKMETAQPIAKAGNIPLAIYDHNDLDGLHARIISEADSGNVSLVVWDHSTIGYVADDLLEIQRGTVRWPMDRYDVIWEIDLKEKKMLQYCQHLLFGDLWCPVNPIIVFPFLSSSGKPTSPEAEKNVLA